MFIWIGFCLLICLLLALDLGLLHGKAHTPTAREAVIWTLGWVTLGLSFSGFIYWAYTYDWIPGATELTGRVAVLKYLSAYLVEQSLSMDNIFVIALIFGYFKIPSEHQHRILFWGILGAIVFRGLMIGVGAVLLDQFHGLIYVFGVLLLYSAWKMMKSGETAVDMQSNPTIRFIRRVLPVSKGMYGERFFIRRRNVWAVTPLFVALMVVETTDIFFAFDSIPAIFAITTDPFLVFSSNIFAILGLRSLYFVLASMLDKFRYLKPALVFILFFVGIKMLSSHFLHWPEWVSLVVIVGALSTGILLSIREPQNSPSDVLTSPAVRMLKKGCKGSNIL